MVLRQGNARLYSALFAPDGRTLLTTGHDGKARLWWIGKSTEDLVSATRPPELRCLGQEKTSFYGTMQRLRRSETYRASMCAPAPSLEPSE
jgi:WD40 repeat protein